MIAVLFSDLMAPLESKSTSQQEKSSGDSEKTALKKDAPPELSEEDKALQEELNTTVEKLQNASQVEQKDALELLRSKLRESTNSMTSVPKPLKFLMPHYKLLKEEVYFKLDSQENRKLCADILSVLAMVCSEDNDCLNYRKLGSREAIGSWGHEYVLHVSNEIGTVWNSLDVEAADVNDKRDELQNIVKEIVPYFMQHNAESDACDILMEIENLDALVEYCDINTYSRVCLYLISCVKYVAEPENTNLLKCAYKIYRKFDKLPDAMRLAMCLNDTTLMVDVFESSQTSQLQKQLSFMLGRQQIYLELEAMNVSEEDADVDELKEIMTNGKLNGNFLALARELDIMEPKLPADIYKSHLDQNKFLT